jgi:hypothetical protein
LGTILDNHPGDRFESQAVESVEMIEENVSMKEAQVMRKTEKGV